MADPGLSPHASPGGFDFQVWLAATEQQPAWIIAIAIIILGVVATIVLYRIVARSLTRLEELSGEVERLRRVLDTPAEAGEEQPAPQAAAEPADPDGPALAARIGQMEIQQAEAFDTISRGIEQIVQTHGAAMDEIEKLKDAVAENAAAIAQVREDLTATGSSLAVPAVKLPPRTAQQEDYLRDQVARMCEDMGMET